MPRRDERPATEPRVTGETGPPEAATDAPLDDEHVSPRAWRALAVASIGTVLVGFNSTATNIALDDIRDGFIGATAAQVGWGVALYFIGTAAFLPLAGRLADRLGRKRLFQTGLALFAASAVLSAVAPTVWTLNLARALQAIGGAAVLPSSLSLVLPMFPQSRRTTAVGLWSAAGPMAAAIAPTTAALLLDASNWRVVYGVSAPVALGMLVVGAWVLVEQPTQSTQHRLDVTGAFAGTVAMALAVTAIMQGGDWGYSSPLFIGVASGAAVALVVFSANSLRHPEPLLNLHILSRRGVWVPNLANFLVGLTSLTIWLVWPLVMLNVWGYSKATVGAALTVGPVVAGASTVVFSRFGDRIGAAWLSRFGALIQVSAVTLLLFRLEAEPNYWGSLGPAIALYGLGWGMTIPLLNSLALKAVSETHYGEVNGLFNTLRYASAAIGTAVLFALLTVDGGAESIPYYKRALVFFAIAGTASFVALLVPFGGHARRSPQPLAR